MEAKESRPIPKSRPAGHQPAHRRAPNLDIIDTNQTVKLHLKDTNTEAVIEKGKP